MNTEESQWLPATPVKLMDSHEVHIWRVFLDVSELQKESLLALLSADEVQRAARFLFERDQRRFIAARGRLRQILGHYLEEHPRELRFTYTDYGKPLLATSLSFGILHFNLSHSGVFGLCAVARDRDVGIDIECIRDDVAVGQIAARFFSPGEIRSFKSADAKNQRELFFQYWTRKEALLKGTGKGISFPMEQLDVSSINGRDFSPLSLPGDRSKGLPWHVQDLFPGLGYAAAIAVEGGDCEILQWHYSG